MEFDAITVMVILTSSFAHGSSESVKTVTEGEGISLICGNVSQGINVVWTKDTKLLPINSTTYDITTAKLKDSGQYQCRLNGSQLVVNITLEVLKDGGFPVIDAIAVCLFLGLTITIFGPIVYLVLKRNKEIQSCRKTTKMLRGTNRYKRDELESAPTTPNVERMPKTAARNKGADLDSAPATPRISERTPKAFRNKGAELDSAPATPRIERTPKSLVESKRENSGCHLGANGCETMDGLKAKDGWKTTTFI